jgi:hypothetical protein
MSPSPLFLYDPLPEVITSVPDDKPCLMIIQVQGPEQCVLFSQHLTRKVSAIAITLDEGTTLKMTINLIDQA